MEYLDASTENSQRELINDGQKDTFVYMNSSKWCNLQTGEGRRIALCHVLALLRWQDRGVDQYIKGSIAGSRDRIDLSDDSDHSQDSSGDSMEL
jgi:hypothetical protein